MSDKDEVAAMAERQGGWESLARALFRELSTYQEDDQTRRAFNQKTRGRKIVRDLHWYFLVEDILRTEKLKNPHNKEVFIIGQHLPLLYGDKLRSNSSARNAANKTVQNKLAAYRKLLKPLRVVYDSAANPLRHLVEMDESATEQVGNESDNHIT